MSDMHDGPELAAMAKTLELVRKCVSEDAQPRPKVAAVALRNGQELASAYRGELGQGEHAEYTLLQRKLSGANLEDAVLFTSLEPCTERGPGKNPCARWIVDRGIRTVFVGMLDPNPVVYERGVREMRCAGVTVKYFTHSVREQIIAENATFMDQFKSCAQPAATVQFNFRHNDGQFAIGDGTLRFTTRWSNGSGHGIHAYVNPPSVSAIAVVTSATNFAEVGDATAYDMSSTSCFVKEGEFLVLRNAAGYAAIRVVDVMARSHEDSHDALRFEYRINADGGSEFSA